MYHPYFRGKQFELITIRDMATRMAAAGFVPIIEPVKKALSGLEKSIQSICDANGRAIVIVNPYHGEDQKDGISTLLQTCHSGNSAISAGVLLRSNTTLAEAKAAYESHQDNSPTFVHAGFTSQKGLADYLDTDLKKSRHIFIEQYANTLYRKPFEGSTRVLIRDGFNRLKNAEYANAPLEVFSELHLTYGDLNVSGFGDFLIVGDSYSDGGGPAYAVAIHLTFIDPDKDDVMYVHHFVSTSNDTQADPAGKFAQALEKLVNHLDGGSSKLLETTAIKQFRDLHNKGHFPGLGHVKKLSMNHHIETLAQFLS